MLTSMLWKHLFLKEHHNDSWIIKPWGSYLHISISYIMFRSAHVAAAVPCIQPNEGKWIVHNRHITIVQNRHISKCAYLHREDCLPVHPLFFNIGKVQFRTRAMWLQVGGSFHMHLPFIQSLEPKERFIAHFLASKVQIVVVIRTCLFLNSWPNLVQSRQTCDWMAGKSCLGLLDLFV